jgi:SAM-dependent methyltransferase
MIAGARRAALKLGLNNAHFESASVDSLPFAPDHFDAAVCRLGVMFFPSPVDGVREMLRVLKPGRKLAFAVWHDSDRNPFFHVLSRVIDRYVEPTPAAPDAPDAFRFAPTGKLRNILVEAGVEAATERVLHFPIHAPMSHEDFWELRIGMAEKLRQKVSALNDDKVAEIRGSVIEDLREYSTPDGLVFPSEVLIVSGLKKSPK